MDILRPNSPDDNHTGEKQCPDCQRWLPVTPKFFFRNIKSKDGFLTYCKICCKIRKNQPKIEIPQGMKQCPKCEAILPATADFFYRTAAEKSGLSSWCKTCRWPNKKPRLSVSERFWSKVDKSGECWLWTGGMIKNGYGQFTPKHGKRVIAHRMAWELTYGPIPDGLWVLHHCDNRLCVRPDHFFLGTASDNMRDCAAKGRMGLQRNPESAPCRKLTAEQVQEIRRAYARGGILLRELAEQYGVNLTTIHYILKGRSWQHLTDTTREETEQ